MNDDLVYSPEGGVLSFVFVYLSLRRQQRSEFHNIYLFFSGNAYFISLVFHQVLPRCFKVVSGHFTPSGYGKQKTIILTGWCITRTEILFYTMNAMIDMHCFEKCKTLVCDDVNIYKVDIDET